MREVDDDGVLRHAGERAVEGAAVEAELPPCRQVVDAGQDEPGRGLGPPVAQRPDPRRLVDREAPLEPRVELVVPGDAPDAQRRPESRAARERAGRPVPPRCRRGRRSRRRGRARGRSPRRPASRATARREASRGGGPRAGRASAPCARPGAKAPSPRASPRAVRARPGRARRPTATPATASATDRAGTAPFGQSFPKPVTTSATRSEANARKRTPIQTAPNELHAPREGPRGRPREDPPERVGEPEQREDGDPRRERHGPRQGRNRERPLERVDVEESPDGENDPEEEGEPPRSAHPAECKGGGSAARPLYNPRP